MIALGGLWIGCGSTAPPPPAVASAEAAPGGEVEPAADTDPVGAQAPVVASQPDAAKLKAHVEKHIEYPATKAQIMDACAETPEFSVAEREWIRETLPDGAYTSREELLGALHLQ